MARELRDWPQSRQPRRPLRGRQPGRTRPSGSTFTASDRGSSVSGGCGATRRRSASGCCSSCSWPYAPPRRSGQTTWRRRDRATSTSPTRSRSTARRSTSSGSTACRSGRPRPTKKFFLGADGNGRDIMVRLLYGGRNSPDIGVAAAIMTTILSVAMGLVAGYFRGWIDLVIRTLLDIMWSFPVLLLGVALGTALASGGLEDRPDQARRRLARDPDLDHRGRLRPLHGAADPRPGALAAREGVHRGGPGAGRRAVRIMFSEILPNLASTIVVFFPLMVANAILLEAALSFLGAGVQPPEPVVGHDDRRGRRPHHHRAAPGDRAGHHARAHGAGAERLRRRRARRARPARRRSGWSTRRMGRFVVRRLLQMVLVLCAVSVLTFLIFNVIPNGDPAVRMAGNATRPRRRSRRSARSGASTTASSSSTSRR